MFGLLRRRTHERAGYTLYTEAVRAARDPRFYTALGVPDTLDGRFDLISLHVALLVGRLRTDAPPGPAIAQAVFDAMFADMDFTLREMGVGDMSVGKRNKEMWEAFHGRAMAYEAALAAEDAEAEQTLHTVLQRNVWRDVAPPAGAVDDLARTVRALDASLRATPLARFKEASPVFAPAVVAQPAFTQAVGQS